MTLRADLAFLYRDVAARGLIVGSSGNVSARSKRGGMVITPTGANGAGVTSASLIEMEMDGTYHSQRQPSSEWEMHAAIYAQEPKAQVIVHTHSDYATALSCLNLPLPAFHYDIAQFGGADVRVARYATFGTPEIARNAAKAIKGRTACLLANHGMICHAETIEAALLTAVRLEAMARQYMIARAAGEVRLLTQAEIDATIVRYQTYGQRDQL